MRYFYLENYGCQMNRADSNSLIHSLRDIGFIQTDDMKKADSIIINTCSVRERAEERVFGRVRYFAFIKKRFNKNLKIIIMGCMAQTSKDTLYSFGADNVFDVYNEIDIAQYLKSDILDEKEFNKDYVFHKPYIDDIYTHKAFLPITHGCDNWCSYCIVPHTRGHLLSRKSSEILEGVRQLIGEGAKDITLLGQNVNSYGLDTDDITFTDLLYEIDKIIGDNDIWLKFMTSHPKDFDKTIAIAIRDLSSLCEHLHLPFQSGSNRILDVMNRKYTIEDYLEKVSYLRDIDPSFVLSTDIIVGFALETESEFQETLNVVTSVGFEEAYLYRYSERPLTVASQKNIPYDVDKGKDMLSRLIGVQRKIAHDLLSKQVGKTLKVMIDFIAKDKKNYLAKTRDNRSIIIDGSNGKTYTSGDIYNVQIKSIRGHSLMGEII